jgi:hypothetical protein
MRLVAVLALAAATLLASGPAQAADLDWAGDFTALKTSLARNYANFEQTIVDRRLDLPALAARYEQQLAQAKDDAARRAVFQALLRDLRDPHVRIEWPTTSGEGNPQAACPAGLAALAASGGVRWERLEGWSPLPGDASTFKAGVLHGVAGGDVGIIRIGLFIEQAYPELCGEAARQLSIKLGAPCDGPCETRLNALTGRLLNARLTETVKALEAAGARRLVLDVSDNSGGSEWRRCCASWPALSAPTPSPCSSTRRGANNWRPS